MSQYTQQDKTLALTGIYQAAQLVYQLASSGEADEKALKASIDSLFINNPTNTLNVFGDDVDNLQTGVETLLAQMNGNVSVQERNIEVTRYALSLMILAKKLRQGGDGLQKISNVLETAESQREHFGDMHENVIATIARAYSENVSIMTPRIMVNGHHQHLNNQRIANKIRALLLAGIRSALLWYQVGGSRWGLIWSRKKYLQNAKVLHRPQASPNNDKVTSLFNDEQDPSDKS
ncbi:high frequency lysogenization protein HflD [Thiomicrorhabdus sp. 6S2-11]|jgi:high frequency lysogenization protein|uniref:High frequency lysogenization protein HflD homolog n=1 Tax=Thiomicrorhabdus marina TaxID=2818442 RepID=A0ABS3Q4H0_9GAMM|nr:high frequency lysogenization protein HflD [Thiomicrorhabdus marina]MBO1926859.1 high frequency lysogenization protein HflD [Thiomicrorhabdus marina]